MIDGRRGRGDASPEGDEEELLESAEVESAPWIAVETGGAASTDASNTVADNQAAAPRATVFASFVRVLKAIGPRLVKMGVQADHVTVVGMLLAAVTGVVIGVGQFYLAIALITVGGLMDTLDGAVAKAAGTSSKRGAFFDSVSDRVADMFIFGGLAWYFAAGPGHDPKMVVIPFAILGVSNTISYERAKAESLGYVAKGGLMERAERLIGLAVVLLFHIVLVPLLLVLLALCVVTALQRFFRVWAQASDPAHEANGLAAVAMNALGAGSALRGRRAPRVESRWRTWRDASAGPTRRQRVAVASRARSRRRAEPLSIRLRQAFQSERAGVRATTRTGASGRAARTATPSGRARAERRRQGAESSFRRRLGSGR
ncbi:MAG: CDP-alcohol phosphatidyltransferase family protein [Acidimicrobiales bacterium]|jgi:CDP-diacylglycerol--glycerol-3-phosphate 3-phosphatidyltransferase